VTLPPNKFNNKNDRKSQPYLNHRAYALSHIEKNAFSNLNIDCKFKNRAMDSKDSITQLNSFDREKMYLPNYSRNNTVRGAKGHSRKTSCIGDLDPTPLDFVLDTPNATNRYKSQENSFIKKNTQNIPEINFNKQLNPFTNDNYLRESFLIELFTYISQQKITNYSARVDQNTKIDINSHEYSEFVRSVEKFVEKHKTCGEKCRHLEKFYESLGLLRNSSKKQERFVNSSSAIT